MTTKSIFLSLPVLILLLVGGVLAQVASTEDGIELYRAGKFSEAVNVLCARTEADTKDRLAWLYLGASLIKTDQRKEALKAFRKGSVSWKEQLEAFEKRIEFTRKP